MKKLIIIINVFLFANTINAQQPQPIFASNPFPKTITVSGSAEMEIIPDEIYVNIELKEYQKKEMQRKILKLSNQNFCSHAKQ